MVSNGQGSKAIRDNEGLAACANVPPPTIRRSLEQLPPGADAWEYKILSSTFGASLESTLNAVGLRGWEVVSISAASGTWTITGNKIFALLKRRLPGPDEASGSIQSRGIQPPASSPPTHSRTDPQDTWRLPGQDWIPDAGS